MDFTSLTPLVQQALRASELNDIPTAIELLRRAKREEPSSAWASFLLAAHLAQAGRYDEAEIEYSNSLLLNPDLAIARYELGTLQFTSGRTTAGMLTWQPLLALPEDHYLKIFVQGYIALAGEKLADAAAQFELGVASNRENLPLNANIKLLVHRIRELSPPSSLQDSRTRAADQAPIDAATGHFLLSSYGKNLH